MYLRLSLFVLLPLVGAFRHYVINLPKRGAFTLLCHSVRESLKDLDRSSLQALAKANGIKANLKSSELMKQLEELPVIKSASLNSVSSPSQSPPVTPLKVESGNVEDVLKTQGIVLDDLLALQSTLLTKGKDKLSSSKPVTSKPEESDSLLQDPAALPSTLQDTFTSIQREKIIFDEEERMRRSAERAAKSRKIKEMKKEGKIVEKKKEGKREGSRNELVSKTDAPRPPRPARSTLSPPVNIVAITATTATTTATTTASITNALMSEKNVNAPMRSPKPAVTPPPLPSTPLRPREKSHDASPSPGPSPSPSSSKFVDLNNVTLEEILTHLVDSMGWEGLYQQTSLRCFANDPSLKSSLKALRSPSLLWARKKVEHLYFQSMKRR